MKNLKNVEKINKKFTSTLNLLDEYVKNNKNISRLVVFGPTIKNEAYINSEDAEMYLAVFFDKALAKEYSSEDFTVETCKLENEIPYVLTYAVQNKFKYKRDGQLINKKKKGIVIYESKEKLSD